MGTLARLWHSQIQTGRDAPRTRDIFDIFDIFDRMSSSVEWPPSAVVPVSICNDEAPAHRGLRQRIRRPRAAILQTCFFEFFDFFELPHTAIIRFAGWLKLSSFCQF